MANPDGWTRALGYMSGLLGEEDLGAIRTVARDASIGRMVPDHSRHSTRIIERPIDCLARPDR